MLHLLNVPIHIRDICVFLAPIFRLFFCGLQLQTISRVPPWSWKVMEFRKTIFQAWKVMENSKGMESHGKVKENDDNVKWNF